MSRKVEKDKKVLALRILLVYNQTCCDMIAKKRRLLYDTKIQVFRGANVNK